jgi:ferredoxin-NADP reductase
MQKYTLQGVDDISPTAICLNLKRNRMDRFDFEPGQYITVGFKRFGRTSPMRCFSMVNSPKDSANLQIAMRANGRFTSAISRLKIGSTVVVQGPFGEFIIDPYYDKNIIMLAGGIGITPFISMIKNATETRSRTPMTLLYSLQNQNDIPFLQELIKLERKNPKFNLLLFITDGIVDKLQKLNVYEGRINENHLIQLTNHKFNNYTYFICGPSGFTSTLVEALENNNTDQDRIVTEFFSQGAAKRKNSEVKDLENRVYYLSAASLLLLIGFVTLLDLANYLPKIVKVQANNSQNVAPTIPTSSSNPPTTTSTIDNSNNQVTQPSSNTNSYQTPVTTVS